MARKLLTKLEAMALAAKLAPGLRNFNNRKRIHVTGPDGKVVRELTASEFQKKILEREGVELDADHPLWDACPCGRVFRDGSGGKRGVCNQCRSQAVCPCGCGRKPSKVALNRRKLILRGGKPWRCHAGVWLDMSAEQRSVRGRKSTAARIAKMTPDKRAETSRKMSMARTREQRRESSRKAQAARTAEQRSESARKRWAAMSPDRQAAFRSRIQDTRTPEQRSEAIRKAWATRRSKP